MQVVEAQVFDEVIDEKETDEVRILSYCGFRSISTLWRTRLRLSLMIMMTMKTSKTWIVMDQKNLGAHWSRLLRFLYADTFGEGSWSTDPDPP